MSASVLFYMISSVYYMYVRTYVYEYNLHAFIGTIMSDWNNWVDSCHYWPSPLLQPYQKVTQNIELFIIIALLSLCCFSLLQYLHYLWFCYQVIKPHSCFIHVLRHRCSHMCTYARTHTLLYAHTHTYTVHT